MNKLIAAILLVSFWVMAGQAFSQTTEYTPNLHLALPPAAPNTWGSDYNSNFTILDTAVSSGGVTSTTCPAGTKISSIISGVPACTPTTLINESLNLVGVLRPPQIVANTNDYAPANLGTASTLYINTDASRNLTGITSGANGRLLFIYNNGIQNIVLINESALSSAVNRLAINANITLGPAQGIIIQYDATATRWRAASGVSGAGGQAADNDLTAIAALSATGFATRITTDTWAQRTMTGTANNISITNGDGIVGNPIFDVGANVALSSRSFAPTTGAWNFAAASSFTVKQATNYAPASDGMCGEDTVTFRLKCNLNGVVYTLAHLSEIQPLSVNLTAFSGLIGAAATSPVFTGPGTMSTMQWIACVNSGGNVLHVSSIAGGVPVLSCDPSASGLSGATSNQYVVATGATSFASSADLTRTAGGVIGTPNGLIVGNCTVDCITNNTVAYVGHGAYSLTWPYVGAGASIAMTTGALTTGHALVIGASGQIIDSGGTAGTGDVTLSGVQTLHSKTIANTEVGGDNTVTIGIAPFWDAASFTFPSTSTCTLAAVAQINSGPSIPAVNCTDASTSTFEGQLTLKQNIGTITFTLTVNDLDSSSQHFAGDFSAMCRNNATTVNSTWGTSQSVDITMTTANNNYTGTTAAVTPNGTCTAGATLFWRFVVNTTPFTDAGNARVLGVLMKQAS